MENVWWWPSPSDGGIVPDYPPVELSSDLQAAELGCEDYEVEWDSGDGERGTHTAG